MSAIATPVEDFTPEYESWRHGGWYVVNVRTANGACGCVSRNYTDRKWRIVCDPRPGWPMCPPEKGIDHTYPNRDAAARAERAMWAAVVQARDALADVDLSLIGEMTLTRVVAQR